MNELLSLFTQNILKDNDTKSARYAIGVLAECMRELDSGETDKPLAVDASKPSGIQTKPPYYYVHGQKFKAEIYGIECEGLVSVRGNGCFYLCQNKIDGDAAPEKFGYKYSWCIYEGTESYLDLIKVKNLILYPL